MKKQRTHYDKAFKENAVKLSLDRKNVSDLAHELGISPALLYRWRKDTGNEGKAVSPAMESVLVKEKPAGLQSWKNASKRLKQNVTY
jgi:transposase